MKPHEVPDAIESAAVLDAPANALAALVQSLVPNGAVKDALSGTWLGHPLHPMLTDLPIGFWTSAWVLDIVGGKRSAVAARTLVGMGVLSAVPTAISGASDWADTTERERRVGLVHAAANSLALGCYTMSYVQRRRGRRAKGVAWGWAGATAATVGGYLGGHLIAALGIGVDNTAFEAGPDQWTDAGAIPAAIGVPAEVTVDGVSVLVVRQRDGVQAIADRCTHRGGPLHEGERRGDCIECPWHQSMFRFADGEVERGPATLPQPRYEARERAGRLELRRTE